MRTTNDTIVSLYEAIDKLEKIRKDFPKLSWYPAHHSSSEMWNGNLEVLEGKDSILWKLSRDPVGIKKATNLGYHDGRMWALVIYKELPNIKVMEVCGVNMCHHEDRRQKIVDVIKDLPEDLRLRAYRIMAQHRRKVKRNKAERAALLKRELMELESGN